MEDHIIRNCASGSEYVARGCHSLWHWDQKTSLEEHLLDQFPHESSCKMEFQPQEVGKVYKSSSKPWMSMPLHFENFWFLYWPQTFVFHRPGNAVTIGLVYFFFFLLNNYSCASMTVDSFSIIKASELYIGSCLDHFAHISPLHKRIWFYSSERGYTEHLGLPVLQSDFYFDLINNTQKKSIIIKKKKKPNNNIETPVCPSGLEQMSSLSTCS